MLIINLTATIDTINLCTSDVDVVHLGREAVGIFWTLWDDDKEILPKWSRRMI